MFYELLDTGVINVPWPTLFDHKIFDGQVLEISKICRNCTQKDCVNSSSDKIEQICHKGFTFYKTHIEDLEVVVFGVIGAERKFLPKYQHIKNQIKGRAVSNKQFLEWIGKLSSFLIKLNKVEENIRSQVLHPLHDTMRLAGEVFNISEKIIEKDKTKSFDDNYELASREIKTLYKSAVLLVDTFDSAAIYLNPQSADFGRKRKVEIFKLIDKLRIILNFAENSKSGPRVQLKGSGHKFYNVHESFKLILLALLQNGIKYCQSGDVIINMTESADTACIDVTSIGPLIEKYETEEIFKPGKRGKWADKVSDEGMGVGLYIAKIISDAHEININVVSTPLGYEKNKIPQATNVFSFIVSSIKE